MSNDLAKTESGGVPDWARKASTGISTENLDQSDFRPPRLKMLAGMSPEVMDRMPGASPGNFWMTIFNLNLGPEVTGTPIFRHKTYQVWAPKIAGSEQRGPLASATDGIHWDVPNQSFDIKFFGNPKTYTWRIGKLVTDFNTHKFGTQNPDDPKSKPIATLTYDVLWLLDLPTGVKQLALFTSSRTGAGPTQKFFSTTRAMGTDYFYQRYRIVAERKSGPTGDPYYSYQYQYLGTLESEADGRITRALHDQYSKSGLVADFESEPDESPRSSPRNDNVVPETAVDVDEIPF